MAQTRPFVLLIDDEIERLSRAEAYLVSRGCRVLATTSPVGVGELPERPDLTVVLDDQALDLPALYASIRDRVA